MNEMKGVSITLVDQSISPESLKIGERNSSWRAELSLLGICLKLKFYGIYRQHFDVTKLYFIDINCHVVKVLPVSDSCIP